MIQNEREEDAWKMPEGFAFGDFTNGQGARIRYGHVPATAAARGTLVMVTGFRECIEKYFEVIRDMQKRGFDVWIMDWRGQGGSQRYLQNDPERSHSLGFQEQIDTLRQFVQTIVPQGKKPAEPQGEKPMILSAHSMGAHIGLRCMHDNPNLFDVAFLTSPMIEFNPHGVPKPVARALAAFTCAAGFSTRYAPGCAAWKRDAFEGNQLTSDPVRHRKMQDLYENNPPLRMGEATLGWLNEAFRSVSVMKRKDYLESIHVPLLMQVSQVDMIVDRQAQDKAARRLPDCKVIDIAAARHEIWMEIDELRNQWLGAVDAFLAERLPAQGQRVATPKAQFKNG